MAARIVDLRSDTVTKPTQEMRNAMANAIVGDDVYREDPTVLELEQRAAKFFGKEAALFFPSGTMSNLSAVMAHCWTRGLEMIVGDQSHMFVYEQGGASQLASVHVSTVKNKEDATFDMEELKNKIRPSKELYHEPCTELICLENSHNRCGGRVLPQEFIDEVCALAKSHNVRVHMDGARIINASVYSGIDVSRIVKDCDSVSMCLSKGVGAPVGSVLVGSEDFISRAFSCRKVLGGSMRQSGVLAAAGIIGLNSATERMIKDHQHTKQLAKAICNLQSDLVTVNIEQIQTNMLLLLFKSSKITASQFVNRLKTTTAEERAELGEEITALTSEWVGNRIRVVLHSDIKTDDVMAVIRKVNYIVLREYC